MAGKWQKNVAKLLSKNWALAGLAAVAAALSFPNLCWNFLIPLCPFFTVSLLLNLRREGARRRKIFWSGFFVGYLMVLFGGYWLAYVLHEFGAMPWAAAVGLFLVICGFEAFNFPLFVVIASGAQRFFRIDTAKSPWPELWFSLGLPALFVAVEFLVPKIFPWGLGHSLFNVPVLIQISEITGSAFLSFVIFSLGSSAAYHVAEKLYGGRRVSWRMYGVPGALVVVTLLFGAVRLWPAEIQKGNPFRVALVQANIGSFDKVEAESGALKKIRYVVDTYERLTESALGARGARPDVIVWPETAVPAFLNDENSGYLKELKRKVTEWQVPLVTGGYAMRDAAGGFEYNAAFYLRPLGDGSVTVQTYRKNILLAFGEYMPFGDVFPSLYRLFPEVSHFSRGTGQEVFTFGDKRLGITICYEALLPKFFRKVLARNVTGIINLTNDSWFGPTNEPLTHASMTVFRAVENRTPFIRVANTGLSYVVDDRGRMHDLSRAFTQGVVASEVSIPEIAPRTIYSRFGDWFIVFSILLAGGLGDFARRRGQPVPAQTAASAEEKTKIRKRA